jgi:N-acetylneuraminic acid mutarotase
MVIKFNTFSSSSSSSSPYPVEGHQSFPYTFYASSSLDSNQTDLSPYSFGNANAPQTRFICIFGGANYSASSLSTQYYDELYLYNCDSQQWHIQPTFGDKPNGRSFHSICVCEDIHRVYVFGGKSASWTCDNQLYYLDLTNWMWVLVHVNQHPNSSKQHVPCGRYQHAMVSVDHMIYLYGGLSSMGFTLSDFWIFDTRGQTWKEIKLEGYTPSGRFGHVMHSINNCIYMFGGTNGKAALTDIHIYLCSGTQWRRIDHLLGQGAIFQQQQHEEAITTEITPSEYSEEEIAQLLTLIPGKSMASCIIGNNILIAGGENVKPKQAFNEFFLFDTVNYTLQALQWHLPNDGIKRFSLTHVGATLYLIGGKYVTTITTGATTPTTTTTTEPMSKQQQQQQKMEATYHYFTQVSIPGNFPLVENSIQILSDILLNYNAEYDHLKAVSTLGELVEVQLGIESIIDTSPSLKLAIINLLKHCRSLVDLQSICLILLNYFEIDSRRCLSEDIAYQLLETTEQYLTKIQSFDPLLLNKQKQQKVRTPTHHHHHHHSRSISSDYGSIDAAAAEMEFIMELSIVRQLMKLYQCISTRYDRYNNYILLTKILSIFSSVLQMEHSILNLSNDHDRDLTVSYYQIVIHIQSVVAQLFSQLIQLNNFVDDCNEELLQTSIESSISKYIENTDYVKTNNNSNNNNNNNIRLYDMEVMKTREQLSITYDRLIEVKKNSTSAATTTTTKATNASQLKTGHHLKQQQVYHSPRIAHSIALSQYNDLHSTDWNEIQALSMNEVLRKDEFLTNFQEYVQVFCCEENDNYLSLLLLWCDCMNIVLQKNNDEENDDLLLEQFEEMYENFVEQDSEHYIPSVDVQKLLTDLQEDDCQDIQHSNTLIQKVIDQIEKHELNTVYEEWINSEVFTQQKKEWNNIHSQQQLQEE